MQFRDIFGPRWAENYGNDPCGIKNPDDRREQWIEELKATNWPNLKTAVFKLRRYPKPYDTWLPDLPAFIQASGRITQPTPPPPEPKGTWVDRVCKQSLIRFTWALNSAPSQELSTQLFKAAQETADQFNAVLEGDDSLTAPDVLRVLTKRFRDVMFPQNPTSTTAESNSSTPSGHSDQVAPSSSES